MCEHTEKNRCAAKIAIQTLRECEKPARTLRIVLTEWTAVAKIIKPNSTWKQNTQRARSINNIISATYFAVAVASASVCYCCCCVSLGCACALLWRCEKLSCVLVVLVLVAVLSSVSSSLLSSATFFFSFFILSAVSFHMPSHSLSHHIASLRPFLRAFHEAGKILRKNIPFDSSMSHTSSRQSIWKEQKSNTVFIIDIFKRPIRNRIAIDDWLNAMFVCRQRLLVWLL